MGHQRMYRGSWHAANAMLTTEGPRSFFKGLVPALATVAPYSGLQFGFYALFTSLTEGLKPHVDEMTMTRSMICGALAGLCAKTTVFPFDTIKKRLQVNENELSIMKFLINVCIYVQVVGFEKGRAEMGRTIRYKGVSDCVSKILKHEGFRGLFRGLSPAAIKAIATTAVNFWFYEYAIKLFIRYRKNHRTA